MPRSKGAVTGWTMVMFVRPGLLKLVSNVMAEILSIRTFRNRVMLIHGSIVTGVAVVA